MQTSPEGRAYIERKEGLRLHAYQDIAGVWTIGYGHTGPEVGPGVVWTKEQCDEALTVRLGGEFEPAVNAVCGDVPTTQGQFDAMVSLAYNIGAPGFSRSEVAKLHRQHSYDRAADAFEHWDHVNGRVNEALHQRRVEEGQMYMDASPARYGYGEPDRTPVLSAEPYMTPMGSDPIGHQKSVAVGATTMLAVPLHWWTRTRYGIEMPVEVAMSLLGFIGTMLVWLVPHGRK
jgi:lysozyme